MNRTIPIRGLSALAAATALLLWISLHLNRPYAPATAILVLFAGIENMAVYSALLWALPKSNTAFFSIFVGDALLRLSALGMAAYWLSSRQMAYTTPLLSLGFSYFLLSFIQIPFFHRAV